MLGRDQLRRSSDLVARLGARSSAGHLRWRHRYRRHEQDAHSRDYDYYYQRCDCHRHRLICSGIFLYLAELDSHKRHQHRPSTTGIPGSSFQFRRAWIRLRIFSDSSRPRQDSIRIQRFPSWGLRSPLIGRICFHSTALGSSDSKCMASKHCR